MAVKKSDVEAALKSLKSAANDSVSTSKIDAFPKNLRTWKYELDNEYATDIKGANEISTSFGKNSDYISNYVTDIKDYIKSIKSSVGNYKIVYKDMVGEKQPNDLIK